MEPPGPFFLAMCSSELGLTLPQFFRFRDVVRDEDDFDDDDGDDDDDDDDDDEDEDEDDEEEEEEDEDEEDEEGLGVEGNTGESSAGAP